MRILYAFFIICGIFIFLFSKSTAAYSAPAFKPVPFKKLTTKYDRYFRKYSKRYFGPGLDWRWFKAQAFAESQLDNDAKSWVNAKGIMQIMPRTFSEIKKKNPSFSDIDEPRWNIAAGIYYDGRMFEKWKADRPFADKINFMLASYNAGFGTIVRAQKVTQKSGLNENIWSNVAKTAPEVRRWRHGETLGYVTKINLLMDEWQNNRKF
ncbi:MAG: hypothetical protein IEMM0002_0885 [bacterium]|nr:MAG: hypothetical protein IEMM0002_0885 [bacterium]